MGRIPRGSYQEAGGSVKTFKVGQTRVTSKRVAEQCTWMQQGEGDWYHLLDLVPDYVWYPWWIHIWTEQAKT